MFAVSYVEIFVKMRLHSLGTVNCVRYDKIHEFVLLLDLMGGLSGRQVSDTRHSVTCNQRLAASLILLKIYSLCSNTVKSLASQK